MENRLVACRALKEHLTDCSCVSLVISRSMSSYIASNPRHTRRREFSTTLPSHGRPCVRKRDGMVASVASPEQLLKVHDYDALNEVDIKKLIQRPRIDFSAILDAVCCVSLR
jgi:hypothetical protein